MRGESRGTWTPSVEDRAWLVAEYYETVLDRYPVIGRSENVRETLTEVLRIAVGKHAVDMVDCFQLAVAVRGKLKPR